MRGIAHDLKFECSYFSVLVPSGPNQVLVLGSNLVLVLDSVRTDAGSFLTS